jgi:glycosyltransferase involved in cell wall biosynthesis
MNPPTSGKALSVENVTVAVTVYDRRDYIFQAIQSALDQTIRINVIVVEDSGPDTGLKSLVQEKFGSRIKYIRNARRRGLFDNWNACLELCPTPFLSILHDDDFLHPEFIEAIDELIASAPECGLYFGQTKIVDEKGREIGRPCPALKEPWRKVSLEDFAQNNLLLFPGQLFRVEAARTLGGFRSGSLYAGDYEMWAKLTNEFGAAQTARIVSSIRTHGHWGRGTSRVERSGKIRGLTFVQQKRIATMLKAKKSPTNFNRKELLSKFPISSTFLIRNASSFSPRILRYNHRLLLESRPPSWRYALFRKVARLLGPGFLKWVSKLCKTCFSIAFCASLV